MQLLQLFWSFFQIGLFSIGGGFAAMPIIQSQVVDLHGWLTLKEFADVVTIAEMTPGPIAINAATFVGTRIDGVLGAIVATIGCVTPSCIIVLTLAYFYFKYRDLSAIQGVLGGLRPAVVALIASAGISMVTLAFLGNGGSWLAVRLQEVNWLGILLFAGSLVVLRKWKPNPILVMASCGLMGVIVYGLL